MWAPILVRPKNQLAFHRAFQAQANFLPQSYLIKQQLNSWKILLLPENSWIKLFPPGTWNPELTCEVICLCKELFLCPGRGEESRGEELFVRPVNIQFPVSNWFIEWQNWILHIIYIPISAHEELKTSQETRLIFAFQSAAAAGWGEKHLKHLNKPRSATLGLQSCLSCCSSL